MNTLVESYTNLFVARFDFNRRMMRTVDELIEQIKTSAESVDPNSNIRIVQFCNIQSYSWDPRYYIPSEQAKAVRDDLKRGSFPEAKVARLRKMVLNRSVRYPNGDRVLLNPTTIGLIKSSEIGQLIDFLSEK